MSYRLLLIRHGLTTHNIENRYTGWGDPPLTEIGLQQAQRMAEFVAASFKIDRLYASPLQRAWQTAGAIAAATGLSPEPRPDLKEIFFGRAEGLTESELRLYFPELYAKPREDRSLEFSWPGGERLIDFFHRVRRGVHDLLVPPEGTLAVVAHGGVIGAYLGQVVGDDPLQWFSYSISNCSVTELSINGGGVHLVRLNDTSFLNGLA